MATGSSSRRGLNSSSREMLTRSATRLLRRAAPLTMFGPASRACSAGSRVSSSSSSISAAIMIDVSGVRSSCDTVDRKSLFMRLSSWRCWACARWPSYRRQLSRARPKDDAKRAQQPVIAHVIVSAGRRWRARPPAGRGSPAGHRRPARGRVRPRTRSPRSRGPGQQLSLAERV